MRYSHIQKVLSAALLLAFIAPSGLAVSTVEAATPYSSSMVLSGDVHLTNRNDKITLSLRDSDVKQVLRMFADKAGMNVVFHSSVDGKVTLDLVNMPINDAFNLVLQVAGLNYYTQNNTLVVISKDSADNAAFSRQEMMVFPVKYVSAASIASFLNKNIFGMKKAGMSSINAATVNSATNEIIVFGMKSDAAIVQKVIDELDREPLSKTFAVNHTTPAEMADMICNMLLPSRGVKSGDNGGGDQEPIPPTPGVGTTGGAAGIMTGGAASASSSGNNLKLGEGVLACSVASSASGSVAAPFDVQNLSVSYFPQRGTITLMGGSAAQIQMVEKFIKDNDVKQPQAYVEISIVELSEDGSKEFTNNWEVQSKNWGVTFNSSGTTGGRSGGPGTARLIELERTKPGDLTTKEKIYLPREQWYANGPYITWQMNYLIENKKARVLANPKLLVTNGQESVIDLTQDYVEKVTSEFLSSAGTGVGTIGAVQRTYTIGSDKGIKVTMTPFISPDGYVTMNIKPEYATEAGQVTTVSEAGKDAPRDLQATLLSRRNLDLKNVRVKDGETLVIAGLIQEGEQKTVNKIPVLGDLPIIGAAFRSTSTTKTKTELVIMLTPKIINDGEGSVADSL